MIGAREKIISMIILLAVVLSLGKVYAVSNINIDLKEAEYTEEYKKYLQLSDEEKAKRLVPNKYKVINSKSNTDYLKQLNNTFKMSKLLRSTLSNQYTLQTVIPENVVIKDQMQTNTCWAFATMGALETNLALKDKINGRTTQIYDFSERHMAYGIVREAFLNGAKNPYGLNRPLSAGGNIYMATSYLANGSGAVLESSLPFENNENNIDISQIQNKAVATTLKDTVLFGEPTTEAERQELINNMKQHITNYGGIYAGIHGDAIMSDCYNNQTGALYCAGHDVDHAVLIIGWDDNYSKDNFNEGNRPTDNGAWIIRNSWGTEIKAYNNLLEAKNVVYSNYTEECNTNGWNSASEIPDNVIIELLESTYGTGKVKVENGAVNIEIGNKGYMYISYEDKVVYQQLSGIENVVSSKDYYNIYQNDELGYSRIVVTPNQHAYLANVFTRDSTIKESVDRISFITFQDYNCKVYINPNGDSKAKSDLQQVKLKFGDSITIKPGYRTIEFAEPIELKGDKFVIVLETTTTNPEGTSIVIEDKTVEGWEYATINRGESFLSAEGSFEANVWSDFIDFDAGLSGNVCIKAFTTQNVPKALESIEVTKAPDKTEYIEEEDFDKTGMKVVAKYTNGEENEITNYTITDGSHLAIGKTSVTISYTEDGITKTTNQTITVKEKEIVIVPEKKILESIAITKAPNKTEYIEDENFDKTGMEVVAQYTNGEENEINNYTIVDGSNLAKDKTSVTISYTEDGITKETTQTIIVKEKMLIIEPEEKVLESIFISQSPTKTEYQEEENFDKTGMKVIARYSNGEEAEITNYTILDGNYLTKDKTSVTISYTEEEITKTATQGITVKEKQEIKPEEPDTPINKEPTSCNYTNAKANAINREVYFYTNNENEAYVKMKITISDIQVENEDNTYTYYYYLSDKQGEENIKDNAWKKVEANRENGIYTITIDINTKEMQNIEQISEADNLFIYIKEVAEIDGKSKITISEMSIQNTTEASIYLDDKKVNSLDEITKKEENNSNDKDDTTATGIIPQTGGFPIILTSVMMIAILGGISYYKFKNIDK